MPMFFTPTPRQFHFEPRFYNPEKEKWEQLKKKYETADASNENERTQSSATESDIADADLAYFESKVRALDREKKSKTSKLTWRDLFHKREMPTFNYQPRFSGSAPEGESASTQDTVSNTQARKNVKIKRRFDMEDTEYFKPVSAGKIMLYTLLACMLLYWILF